MKSSCRATLLPQSFAAAAPRTTEKKEEEEFSALLLGWWWVLYFFLGDQPHQYKKKSLVPFLGMMVVYGLDAPAIEQGKTEVFAREKRINHD